MTDKKVLDTDFGKRVYVDGVSVDAVLDFAECGQGKPGHRFLDPYEGFDAIQLCSPACEFHASSLNGLECITAVPMTDVSYKVEVAKIRLVANLDTRAVYPVAVFRCCVCNAPVILSGKAVCR